MASRDMEQGVWLAVVLVGLMVAVASSVVVMAKVVRMVAVMVMGVL